MELRTIPIADLKFAEYNPRKISKANFERLRDSIRNFGMTVPCTVNSHPGRENVLIAGHMRTRAAEAEGLKEVPCWVIDVDENQEKILNIALNNKNLQGDWDDEMLSDLIVKLSADDQPVGLTGFDDDELLALSHGEPPGLNPEKNGVSCVRCEDLRKQLEAHEKRSNHTVYVKENA